MPRDPRAYVWDAAHAADLIASFVEGKKLSDYLADALLRSGVERQFEIIGESLNQLSRADPALASRIPDLPRLVAFRNILIHGYAIVDDALVRNAAVERLPELRSALADLPEGRAHESGPTA